MTKEHRRFLADQMLGRLARWLRAAGEDVGQLEIAGGMTPDDGELLAAARAAGRVVLTRDRRFPGTPAERLIIWSTDLDEQLVEFYRAFPAEPCLQAWSRCTRCNAPVEQVDRLAVVADLPPLVREHGRDFRRCTGCGHLYWEGSHTARMRERLARVRRRLSAEGGEAHPGDRETPAAAVGSPDEFDQLLRVLFREHGLSWRGYRKVRRRLRGPLASRMAELDLARARDYLDRLRVDAAEQRRLNALLAISVSRFFRDREDWAHLAQIAFPALVAAATRGAAQSGGVPDGRSGAGAAGGRSTPADRVVRALCLGCASGEEPFTLRMLWETWKRDASASMIPPLGIVAADVRADLIARARRAVYPRSSVHSAPSALQSRYFTRDGDEYRLDRAIADSIVFVRCDFYDDPIPGPVDLVCCRNSAFTYLTADRLAGVVDRLRDAVRPGGFLMVGGSEGERPPAGFERCGRCLFRRATCGSPSTR